MDDLETRAARLAAILTGLGSVAVAYSGGTDSAFLLAASLEALGAGAVLAVTADSPLMPRAELAEARALAARLGARHVVLPHDELAREAIVANPPDRCYHCKFDRFDLLWRVARAEGLAHLRRIALQRVADVAPLNMPKEAAVLGLEPTLPADGHYGQRQCDCGHRNGHQTYDGQRF